MAIPQFLSTYAIPIAIAVGLLWFGMRQKRHAVTAIDTSDPIWLSAIEKARATLGDMPSLFAQYGSEICVKYPLATRDQEVEHVWGRLLEISGDKVVVSLETRPIGSPTSEPPYVIPMSQLEDWQLVLPSGEIRGGFTTQAQIALARKHGWPVPATIAGTADKFVDRLST